MSVSVIVVVTIPDAVAKAPFETAAFNAATVKLSGPSTSKSSSVGSVNVKFPLNVEASVRPTVVTLPFVTADPTVTPSPAASWRSFRNVSTKSDASAPVSPPGSVIARSTVAVDPTGMIPFAIASV